MSRRSVVLPSNGREKDMPTRRGLPDSPERIQADLAQIAARIKALYAQTDRPVEDRLLDAFEELRATLDELRAMGEELLEQGQELESVRAEAARSGEQLRDLFEHAPDPYVITDQDGIIQRANLAARALLLGGTSWPRGWGIIHCAPEYERGDLRKLMTWLRGRIGSYSIRVRMMNGDHVGFDAHITVANREGDPPLVFWTIRDARIWERIVTDLTSDATDHGP